MATATGIAELIDELKAIDGKAEIVDGRVLQMSPTGRRPGRAAGRIFASLLAVEKIAGGRAYPDNVGFLVNLANRKSFSPDAAFCREADDEGASDDLGFANGAPDFAAEVRSESDYGPQAEETMAAKRADYFAAGTQVVWDVDLLAKEDVVRVYRGNATEPVARFGRGQYANAEPAVPGWSMPVDELFE